MNEFQSLSSRLNELARRSNSRYFPEEAEVVEELIDTAAAAADISLTERNALMAKYRAILAQPTAERAA